jgi:hypothetical protein
MLCPLTHTQLLMLAGQNMAADSDGDYASGCSDYEGGGGGGIVDLIDSDAEEDQVSMYTLCIRLTTLCIHPLPHHMQHCVRYVCSTVHTAAALH